MQNVVGGNEFEITGLYRMYMDRDDIPGNLVRKWKDKPRSALEVSIIVVKDAEELFEQAVVEEEGL